MDQDFYLHNSTQRYTTEHARLEGQTKLFYRTRTIVRMARLYIIISCGKSLSGYKITWSCIVVVL